MSIYTFNAKNIDGEEVSLKNYEGKVLLIVNTASKCGFTPQFTELEALYKTYHEQGFEVLGFPCNQFAAQDPGDEAEIKSFCSLNYNVTFPMFSKIDVNGEGTHPLYQYLKKEGKGLLGDGIKWNFTKFLIDKNGEVVERFSPNTAPSKLKNDIEKLLR